MTIDEAIEYAEAQAEKYELNSHKFECMDNISMFKACAEEHRQLAEWLKELKAYREKYGQTDCAWK